MKGSSTTFLAMGVVFLVLGITGNKAFLAIGFAFFVAGIVAQARGRKDRGQLPDDKP